MKPRFYFCAAYDAYTGGSQWVFRGRKHKRWICRRRDQRGTTTTITKVWVNGWPPPSTLPQGRQGHVARRRQRRLMRKILRGLKP